MEERIAKLDIEKKGPKKYSFKYWRADIKQVIHKPTVNETYLLREKDGLCKEVFKAIRSINLMPSKSLNSETKEKLISNGQLLYRYLLPPSIQKEINHLKKQKIYPLLISTNDPKIPWELLHDGDDFLCISLCVSRDLHGISSETGGMTCFPKNVSSGKNNVKFLFIVNPYDPQEELSDTYEECETIIDSLDDDVTLSHYISDEHATYWTIKREFTKNYEVIHYAGHICLDEKKNKVYIPLPEKGQLYSENIGYISGNPFVFLNGCASDSKSESLAQAFFLNGAKGVLGTIAEIPSLQARTFACTFYENLLSGITIAESVRLARKETRKKFPNDATFLSFVLYGHPESMIPGVRPIKEYRFLKSDGSIDESKFSNEALNILKTAATQASIMGKKKIDLQHFLISFLSKNLDIL